jgi:hypothetical protein
VAVVTKGSSTKLSRVSKHTIRSALVAGLKAQSGRKDIKFDKSADVATRAMDSVAIEQRAGYPVKRAKGSTDPKDWETEKGVKVHVDFKRHAWLPDDWGQGVKITIPTAHSTGTSGGTYTVIIAPDGKSSTIKMPPRSTLAISSARRWVSTVR